MNIKSDYSPPDLNLVPITSNDLSSVGIPARFWSPSVNPFEDCEAPLSWWDDRFKLSREGVGFLSLSSVNSFTELASLTEVLKRLLCDGDRPTLRGDLSSSVLFLRSSDIARKVYPWETLLSTGFLLVSSIGIGFNETVEAKLTELFRYRYEVGAVTFYHIVERLGDRAFLDRVVRMIPEGSYITS